VKYCCIPVADHLELHQVVACSRNGSSSETLSGNMRYAAVLFTVPCLRLRCWLQLVSITDRVDAAGLPQHTTCNASGELRRLQTAQQVSGDTHPFSGVLGRAVLTTFAACDDGCHMMEAAPRRRHHRAASKRWVCAGQPGRPHHQRGVPACTGAAADASGRLQDHERQWHLASVLTWAMLWHAGHSLCGGPGCRPSSG
jgi:hypothetical protein